MVCWRVKQPARSHRAAAFLRPVWGGGNPCPERTAQSPDFAASNARQPVDLAFGTGKHSQLRGLIRPRGYDWRLITRWCVVMVGLARLPVLSGHILGGVRPW